MEESPDHHVTKAVVESFGLLLHTEVKAGHTRKTVTEESNHFISEVTDSVMGTEAV